MQYDLEIRGMSRGNIVEEICQPAILILTHWGAPCWPRNLSESVSSSINQGRWIKGGVNSLPAQKFWDSGIHLIYPFDIQSQVVKFILEIYHLIRIFLGHRSVMFPFSPDTFHCPSHLVMERDPHQTELRSIPICTFSLLPGFLLPNVTTLHSYLSRPALYLTPPEAISTHGRRANTVLRTSFPNFIPTFEQNLFLFILTWRKMFLEEGWKRTNICYMPSVCHTYTYHSHSL